MTEELTGRQVRMAVAVAGFFFAAASVAPAADWTRFRGPEGHGAAVGDDDTPGRLPKAWSADSGIAWSVPLPGRGLSSPIVIGERVLVTANSGYRRDRLHTLCFDARSGAKLWERQLWATGQTQCHPKTSMAAPTPAADDDRVFALFASNDLACYALDGTLLWLRALNVDYPSASNSVGMASSPVVVDGVLVVLLQNDSDPFVVGLDARTGRNRWKLKRPASVNWSTPSASAPSGGYLLLQSSDSFSGHDPATGEELWSVEARCGLIPTAAVSNGVAYLPAGGLQALELKGPGDPPELAWRSPRLRVNTASPLVYRDRIYVLTGSVLKCAELETGELAWQLRLEGSFSSSPVAAGGHLYAFNEKGVCHVVRVEDIDGEARKPAEKGELVGTSEMGESILCTPAISGGGLFVRSDSRIWRVGN